LDPIRRTGNQIARQESTTNQRKIKGEKRVGISCLELVVCSSVAAGEGGGARVLVEETNGGTTDDGAPDRRLDRDDAENWTWAASSPNFTLKARITLPIIPTQYCNNQGEKNYYFSKYCNASSLDTKVEILQRRPKTRPLNRTEQNKYQPHWMSR
jgi:hypothetical protein